VIAICLCIFFVLAIHSKPIYLSNNELRLLAFLASLLFLPFLGKTKHIFQVIIVLERYYSLLDNAH
jgi:hypothetical protein